MVHTAGSTPAWVDLLAAYQFDHALAELAQPDPAPHEVRLLLEQSKNIPLRRRCIHSHQKIRRGEMEET